MRKIIYTILIIISVAFSACTEEEVTPAKEKSSSGGNISADQGF